MTNDKLSKLLDEKLKGLATKSDLEKEIQTIKQTIATKDDIMNMATKQDVQDQVRWAEQRIVDKVEDKIDETFQKYRDEVLTFKDEVIGEVKAIREEQTIHQGMHDDLTDIPERVEKLEAREHPRQSP